MLAIQNPAAKSPNGSPKPRVLVIGAGVSGLTTSICLRRAGFEVVIVADRFAPNLTSVAAGALWEWPPAVCGKHGTPRSLERSKKWCMIAYNEFKEIEAKYGSEATGVYLRDVYFYFKYAIESRPTDLQKMNELKDEVEGFERGLHIIRDSIDLDFQGGIQDAYKHMAPMAHTDMYMKWLFQQVQDLGCDIIQDKITTNVLLSEGELLERFNAQAIVNCAGLGSIATTGDSSMYPLRGALVRVKNQGGIIDAAHCISHDESSTDEQDIIFIVPRGKDDVVVLGGLAQQDQWKTNLNLDIPIIRQMYDGCLQFLEELRDLPLDDQEPVRIGLRPFTEKNVCVERVPDTRVFYNYGHGGAGVTLSWGCSAEIVDLIEEMLEQEKALDQFSGATLDPQKQTVFILHDAQPIKFDLQAIKRDDRNLVFLCSRQGLTKLVASQYEYLDLLKVVNPYNLESLLQTVDHIQTTFGLQNSHCRVITSDDYSVLFAAEMRQALDLAGDRPALVQPFTNKYSLKVDLQSTSITLPKYVLFEPQQYREAPQAYLDSVVQRLGEAIFVKPVVGAGSEKTQRIDRRHELATWCDNHVNDAEAFEFNEFISGQLYNTSLVIKEGKICHVAACHHYRPNDEFLLGQPLGNIVVPETDPIFPTLQQFSLDTLAGLSQGYPPNGIVNIDFFIQDGTETPVLMEIASRPPGGFVSKMFELYQGINLQELHQTLQMGDAPEVKVNASAAGKYSAYVIYPKRSGTVLDIEKPVFKSEVEVSWNIYLGQDLQASSNMREVAIGILLSHRDLDVLRADYHAALAQDFYTVGQADTQVINHVSTSAAAGLTEPKLTALKLG